MSNKDHAETAIANAEAALADANAMCAKLAQCLSDAQVRMSVLRGIVITPQTGGGPGGPPIKP
jgi:hypothetical protein